ncbi:CoA transferase [Caballeronia sp. LP003]|uniref:CaiB/BaiF CoA transferase family protein n=1 Tax=Caballeronia sp. LP003 TaxID=3038551 RepID=UPI002862A859|nr:CoA transferase [Caballeronia sp. LP003]MDR5785281.1 CoA transferase [Caballeronia sp. LP003]
MSSNKPKELRSNGPLMGIKVVDMTTVAMGPYATQILGDMGADVIKVEAPGGDVFRHASPAVHPGMGAAFLNLNRNKRSIGLDLKNPSDKKILIDLILNADVFVFNVRPQSMRKLGLSYDELSALNSRLIYCGAYGFSESGPYAGRPAFDDIIQAMSGMASLQSSNREVGPSYVNTILADKTAGLTLVYAISMALYEREKSGAGQAIEVPMFETMVSFNLVEHLAGETFDPPRGGMGYERVLSPYRRPYRTSDGFLSLMPYTTAQWQRFFEVADRKDLVHDPRVTLPQQRSESIGELYSILAEIVQQRSTADWIAVLGQADVPCAPVNSPERLLSDAHLEAIDFFQDCTHPSEGKIRTMRVPVKFSRTPGGVRRLAPTLDEHRAEIVNELKSASKQRTSN